jgi:hypothetical protein
MASAVRTLRLAWNDVDLDLALGPVTLLSFERPLSVAVLLVDDRSTRTLKTP